MAREGKYYFLNKMAVLKLNSSKQKNVESVQRPSVHSILWYLGVILSSVLSIVSVLLISPTSFPLVIVRWISGLIMLLWMPGFCFVKLLFPSKTIRSIETVTLSVALSIIMVIIIALICNFTPLGISEIPIIAILSAISVAFASIAIYNSARAWDVEILGSDSL
jgi:uncharacterized membrane protein